MNSQNLSCSYANSLFLDKKEQNEEKGKEEIPVIGKEDIRIPVVINGIRRNSFEGKAKVINIAICEISGCTFPILISPALSLEFFWRSPLAVRKNAIKIASLGRLEMVKLPAEYIAGSILSLLSAEELIEDRLPASERNEILVTLFSDVQLVEALIRIKTMADWGHSDRFPKIAFSRLWNADNFTNFLNECEFIKNPPKAQDSSQEILSSTGKKTKISARITAEKKWAMPFSMRTRIAFLADLLGTSGVISKKAAGIFKWLQTSHNYRELTAEHRTKYVQYLTEKNTPECEELAVLISKISIVKNPNDLEDDNEELLPSEIVASEGKTTEPEKKLSLVEKLALLKGKG